MQWTMVTSTCVHVGPGAQRAAQVLHHLGHQLRLPEVRGPHRGVSAHEGDQRGPAPALRVVLGVSLGLGAVVECDADGARADQLAAEAGQPPVRPVVVEDDLEDNNDDDDDDDDDDGREVYCDR